MITKFEYLLAKYIFSSVPDNQGKKTLKKQIIMHQTIIGFGNWNQ